MAALMLLMLILSCGTLSAALEIGMGAGRRHSMEMMSRKCPEAAAQRWLEEHHLCEDGTAPVCSDGSDPQWTHPTSTPICGGNGWPLCKDGLGEFNDWMNPCHVAAAQEELERKHESLGGKRERRAGPEGNGLVEQPPQGQGGPHAVSAFGTVGLTTVSGNRPVGEDIFGPFEAGFGPGQDRVLEGLGCSDPSLAYSEGGMDVYNAEQVMAYNCGVTLPRYENGRRIALLDECGGHTNAYHFHRDLACLYEESGYHSPKIGDATRQIGDYGTGLYGKWENFETGELPLLDACGGHFGFTPESTAVEVYHYHVQENAPFTFGCWGPNDDGSLVTVEQCRDFYPDDCGNGDHENITTKDGTWTYDLFCPCFDANGNNFGTIAELAVFKNEASPTPSPTPQPTPEPSPQPTHQPASCEDVEGTGTPWGWSCQALQAHGYCFFSEVQRECPQSCDSCGCDDAVGTNTPWGWSCAVLAAYCAIQDVQRECPVSCGLCR